MLKIHISQEKENVSSHQSSFGNRNRSWLWTLVQDMVSSDIWVMSTVVGSYVVSYPVCLSLLFEQQTTRRPLLSRVSNSCKHVKHAWEIISNFSKQIVSFHWLNPFSLKSLEEPSYTIWNSGCYLQGGSGSKGKMLTCLSKMIEQQYPTKKPSFW